MTSLPNPLPYGIKQILLTPYADAQGSVLSSTSYPLPVAMTLGFSETEQFDELRGDDELVAVHGRGPQVDWSLEAGGMSIKAWSIISGAMVIESGVTPTRQVRLRKSGDDLRPYFRIDGRVISDSGGNIIARIYRAKANGRLQADHRGGAFQTSNIDGIGMPLVGDQGRWLYEIIQNETDSAMSTTPEANPLAIPTGLHTTAVAATSVTLAWDPVSIATSYRVQQSVDAGVTWTNVTTDPTTPTKTVSSLTTATAYQWRVAAMVSSQVGDFCTPILVTTS
jgi:hypothetical protein